ncbi:MAG TPA: NAD(P)-binding protein, partial [Acidimicrobiales bacterium]|nr:NAD(P)-binding protein [Acidimicrobiales bacterium]
MDRPFAITLGVGSSLANHTGTWRVERPVYGDRLPPCNDACPAGENVQRWLYHAEEGDYEQAWRVLVADNPLPAVMGRVCYHPCETSCNRAQHDEAVGINAVERFLGDEALRRGWALPGAGPDTGKRVLVVGSGPAGLSVAYHLRRLGHGVTIREATPKPGGMMRYGIPHYRLPRDVLDGEIEQLLALGITLELGATVTDVPGAMASGGFDAVFLAVGAGISRRAYVPAGDAARVVDALSLLRGMEADERPLLGRRVAVYGGGDTAMDAARTARRLGATDAVVVYRRTRDRMPAHDEEVDEALAEGVRMRWLSTVKQADAGRLVIEKMVLDEHGFPQPTGELEELQADTLVLALGQESDLSLIGAMGDVGVRDGVVEVGTDLMTGHPGVFAGGDMSGMVTAGAMTPAERTVTTAIGHGKQAARHIDAWLRGATYAPAVRHEVAGFDRMNPWYYADAPRTMRPRLEPARRTSTFDEVVHGLDESTALYEARRCLSCGNCLACDNCYGLCPDNAVRKVAPGTAYGYEIDMNYCKGCGICAAECPAGAITMVPE